MTLFSLTSRPRGSLFSEVDRMRRRMEELLASSPAAMPSAGVFPAVNLSEDEDNLYLRAELPGVSAEDIEISVVERQLTLRGQRKIPDIAAEANVHRRERESGFFRRVIALPTPVSADKVNAKTAGGVLTITLPKAAEAKPRTIAVKAS